MNAPDDTRAAAGRQQLNPMIKPVGVIVGVAAVWLVVSTAGGVGDSVTAVT